MAGSRRKEAELLPQRILEEVAAGTWWEIKKNPTLFEISRSSLEAKKAELKPSTFKDYGEAICNHILPALGKPHLREMSPLRIQMSLLHLQEKGISPSTTGKVYMVLKVLLRRAVALELLDRDPTVRVIPPCVDRKEMCASPRRRCAVSSKPRRGRTSGTSSSRQCSRVTGMRQGELLALRWQDVDLKGRKINVV